MAAVRNRFFHLELGIHACGATSSESLPKSHADVLGIIFDHHSEVLALSALDSGLEFTAGETVTGAFHGTSGLRVRVAVAILCQAMRPKRK